MARISKSTSDTRLSYRNPGAAFSATDTPPTSLWDWHMRAHTKMLLVLAIGMLAGCGEPAAPPQPPVMEVSVATVPEREITEWDEYTGRLEAVQTVEIRPQ